MLIQGEWGGPGVGGTVRSNGGGGQEQRGAC